MPDRTPPPVLLSPSLALAAASARVVLSLADAASLFWLYPLLYGTVVFPLRHGLIVRPPEDQDVGDVPRVIQQQVAQRVEAGNDAVVHPPPIAAPGTPK